MDKIIHLENYVKQSYFDEQVLPFFHMLNAPFHYHLEDEKVMFSIPYKQHFLYVFLEYTPRNQHTEKPIVLDRFFNVKSNPRISKGEWVVDKIYEIGNDYHNYLEENSAKIEKNESIVEWFHQEILK